MTNTSAPQPKPLADWSDAEKRATIEKIFNENRDSSGLQTER